MPTLRIGLIGDRDDKVIAHRAIPLALAMSAESAGVSLEPVWIPTEQIADTTGLGGFDGLWCVPASPYRNMEGALLAIRHARENRIPFLGTCGGFQHVVVEYARNVLGWTNADHAETVPDAARAVIVPLSCALVEVHEVVHLRSGSRIAAVYGARTIEAGYHCRYGLGDNFRAALAGEALRISAKDDNGDVRAMELDGHPFFVATLFQHERAALAGNCPPLVRAFVDAACRRASIAEAA